MSEANKELAIRWYEEVWNQHNEAAIDELFSIDGKCYGFPDSESAIGREEFKASHRTFCGAFPDLHVTIEDVIAENDRVAIRWKTSMTHTGDHLGFAATGKKSALTGVSIIQIAGGQIIDGWNEVNIPGLIQKLKDPSA
jgi:steroid delta-isomerase-like uncharacterized protein